MLADLHAHILPGIDDGPEDLAGSVALARAAWQSGTTAITATPHLRDDHPAVRPYELAGACQRVADAVVEAGIGLEIIPAAEVDLMWASSATPEELRLATYGQHGTDMLVETPYGQLPPGFDDLLFRVTVQGYRVVLAHPERNPTFQRRPERILDLVHRGVLMQLTGSSLTSPNRNSKSRRLAHWMLEQGVVHVVASDAHSAGPWRPPDLTVAERTVARFDAARAQWIFREVPPAILAGEPLPPMPARTAPRLRRLLRGSAR